MGFDADWQLAGYMRAGMRGSGYPKGYLSEKRECPDCGKPVAGRATGMAEHLMAAHGYPRMRAHDRIDKSGITWSSEEEIRQRNAIEARQGGDAKQAPAQDESAVRQDAPNSHSHSHTKEPNNDKG